jgi:hypothetical protein
MPPEQAARFYTHQFSSGTRAWDFTLNSVDGERRVHLGDLHGKTPVVLLFGSFGCDAFCKNLPRLTELHQKYHDRAAFFFVYGKEAPHKGVLPPLPGEDVFARIQRGLKHFKLSMPCLIADDAVNMAYQNFPARVLIVDRNGQIALDLGRPMSPHWKLDQLEEWLKQAPVLRPSTSTSDLGT